MAIIITIVVIAPQHYVHERSRYHCREIIRNKPEARKVGIHGKHKTTKQTRIGGTEWTGQTNQSVFVSLRFVFVASLIWMTR